MRSWAPVLVIATGLQLWIAARFSLLADEAYYATWGEALAWGYYDQPPLIAVCFRIASWLGHTELAVRVPAIAAGLIGWAAMARVTGSRFATWWWIGVPPLVWLTLFSTPDAPLLAAWSVGIAAAIAGGPWWWLVGLAGGLATLGKYTGLALFPLAWLGARDRDRHVLGGLIVHLVVIAPHLLWLAGHDFVSVRFQLGEGLLHPHTPGWTGPLQVVAQQLGVLTPLTAAAIAWVWVRPPDRDRTTRIAWSTSAPLVLFFGLASIGGPPEAHWPAPAWIGAGILLAKARGRLERLAWAGLGVGVLASVLLAAHGLFRIVPLRLDPADRVAEGPLLAEAVGAWALPDGVGLREPGVERAMPVYTERYQEAALIRWYAGIPAHTHPDCGRPNTLAARPEGAFLFVRPPTTHPPTCVEAGARHQLVAQAPGGPVVGRWDLFEDCR